MDEHRHLPLGVNTHNLGVLGLVRGFERHHLELDFQPLLQSGNLGLGAKHTERSGEEAQRCSCFGHWFFLAGSWWIVTPTSPCDSPGSGGARACPAQMPCCAGQDIAEACRYFRSSWNGRLRIPTASCVSANSRSKSSTNASRGRVCIGADRSSGCTARAPNYLVHSIRSSPPHEVPTARVMITDRLTCLLLQTGCSVLSTC